MAINVISAKLNAKQCWPAVWGGLGLYAGSEPGLQLGFGCQVIPRLLSIADSSLSLFLL